MRNIKANRAEIKGIKKPGKKDFAVLAQLDTYMLAAYGGYAFKGLNGDIALAAFDLRDIGLFCVQLCR